MRTFSAQIENYNLTVLDSTLDNPVTCWKVDAHLHNFYEMHYILSGSASLYLNGKTVELHEHELIFINKNNLHYSISHSEDLRFVSLAFEVIKNNNETSASLDYVKIKKYLFGASDFMIVKNKIIEQVFSDLYKETSQELLNAKIYQSALLIFLSFINELIEQTTLLDEDIPFENSRKYKDEIIKIDKYISEHYMEDISIKELAKMFYLSERQMSRIFNDLIGESFHKSLLRQRMNVAIKHIKDDDVALTEIPYVCGFNSYSGFFIAFKKYFGCSPNEYKDMLKNLEDK